MNKKAKPTAISIDDFEKIYYFATTKYLDGYLEGMVLEELTDEEKEIIEEFQEITKGILITFEKNFYYYSTEVFISSDYILKELTLEK